MGDERARKRGSVMLDGRTVEYCVLMSPRARRVRLRIGAEDGLTVVLPRGARRALAAEILLGNSRWVLDRLQALDAARATRPALVDGSDIPYRGGVVRLSIRGGAGQNEQVVCMGGELIVRLPPRREDRLPMAVEAWYRREAQRILPSRVAWFAAGYGVKPARIAIRSQRTLWASCSSRGTLSFNWRLIAVPSVVMDYVMIHELTHLEEMNHSRRFWSLVEARCPDYRAHRTWLKENSVRLLSWPGRPI